ncbi:MAG: FIST C-terminal domain-containing protein [Candidatus Diapherotrites archaeon]|nr:FIST C-terminal domain-containing protein [Candidatus Diapherotrites archaeon]
MNMLKAWSGESIKSDSFAAGEEACSNALSQIKGVINLIVVFATVNYSQEEVLKGVKSLAKDALVVGCSGLRCISNNHGFDKGVAVMAVSSDDIILKSAIGINAQKDSREAGYSLAKSLVNEATAVLMIFMDGVGVNGSAVVRGILDGSRKNLPIIGGMASDASTFTKTYEYHQGEVLSDAVVGVAMSGKVSFGIGVQHGWQSIGLPVTVTKSEGATIQEINGQPAIKFFEEYFGAEEAKQLYKPLSRICYVYPLGMSVEGSDELLIRIAFVANEKGELVCAGEVPQGSQIRLMLGDHEKAIEAAREATEKAKEQLKGATPKAAIVFNCAARYMLLGKRADEEIQAIQSVLGGNVPLIGFYTYGEQAPLRGDIGPACSSLFHNETMTMILLGE